MRIRQLELIKYGKFTGTRLDFPAAAHDFHVVVGPNEAGKSTLRSAIAELLFGMPARSPLGFDHPLSELRLGGVVEGDPGLLAFHRSRSRSSLRTPADEVLPDSRLSPFLGPADKAFFEQMFGLDHTQLVKGGQSILDSSKDVGQALFQSAAGIASLGAVRERLAEQAALLWAPRQTKNGQYAQAARSFDEASAELKAVQVKTKVWTEARNARDEVERSVEREQARRLALEGERSRLERVRRLGPVLIKLGAAQAGLQALGEGVDFPPDAHTELTRGQAELSAAQVLLDARRADVEHRQAEVAAIDVDADILRLASRIEALESTRQQCRNHHRDLPLRQAEVDNGLAQAKKDCAQLGWPVDEAGLRAHLPTELALRTVGNLLRDRGALHQAMQGSAQAVSHKQRELDDLGAQLDEEGDAAELPAGLRQAAQDALALKGSPARQQALADAVAQARLAVAHALADLGEWAAPIDALRGMKLPSVERVAALERDRQARRAAVVHARARLEDARAAQSQAELAVRHFAQSHAVVTAMEVDAARATRDGHWDALKHGRQPLADGAPLLDAAMRLADKLVDAQLGAANEAAGLLARRHQVETAAAEVGRLQDLLAAREAELSADEAEWSATARACGLPGMPQGDMAGWMARRDAALVANAEAAARQQALDAEAAGCEGARKELLAALHAARVAVSDGDDLATLADAAQRHIAAADSARQRRLALQQQHQQARQALDGLQAASTLAAARHAEWEAQWTTALRHARLEAASATLAQAEGAVELANQVASALQRARETQEQRIDTMRDDLSRFAAEALRLARELEPGRSATEDPADACQRLHERLRTALAASQRAELANQALRTAQQQRDDADLRARAAQARLQPLLDLAGVDTVAEALPRVDRSDRKRQLQQEVAATRDTLIADGDGLALEAIEAEVAAQPAADVHALHEQAKLDLDAVNDRLNQLSQDRLKADQALAAIAGQSTAATAESKRQEALAAMGDAAEQYLQVATAGKLLKWAIDRYRDRQQGPMLQRASAVFAALTVGRFGKLGVDFEHEPPTLYARRATGQVVEVAGLSEGTRDQLYLALRIAALEQYLGPSPALPFVADDLFVNFDDERAEAGLRALRDLSTRTQVIFLSHHHHLVPIVQRVFGGEVNVLWLERSAVTTA
jgi:chromosome segregation protein